MIGNKANTRSKTNDRYGENSMKNIIKLTTDLRRVSGNINRTGTTFLLAGIMVIAIMVITCSPKQSGTATQPQTSSESGTTAGQTQTESGIYEETINPYFIVSNADIDEDYANLSEYDYILDKGGERLLFTATRPFPRSANICIIGIGVDDNFNFYEEGVLVTHDVGSQFVVRTYISETIPNRGIRFTDEDGTRKYGYIAYSGVDDSFKLVQFQNAYEPEYNAFEPIFEDETAELKMNIEATEIIINNIENNITGKVTVVVLVASSRGMVATVAKGSGIISDKTLAVKLLVSDDYDMLNTSDKSPEKGSYYIGLIIPPDETNKQIYGNYEPVVFDRGIVKLDYRKFKI
jgi:hypothetical protein